MNREKSTKLEVKGCLVHGYRSLIEAFERRLLEMGTEIRTGTRVTAVEQDPAGMRVLTEHDSQGFDHVVVTLPLVQFQALTRGLELDPSVAGPRLDYQGVVSGVFLLDRAVDELLLDAGGRQRRDLSGHHRDVEPRAPRAIAGPIRDVPRQLHASGWPALRP